METFTSIPKLRFRAPGSLLRGPIHYAIGHCVQGAILVARGAHGICAIFLDDDAKGLRQQLIQAFPKAALEEAAPSVHDGLGQVISFIDQGAAETLLELDVGGTPFQQRVWSALCDIPAGQTRSYTRLARDIGAPNAVRAVASACAANTLAVAIPCHRVVRADGSLSGYRWGVQRKRDLLRREHVFAPGT